MPASPSEEGSRSSGRPSPDAGVTDPMWFGGAEEPHRAQACPRSAEGRCRAGLRLGRRRDGAAVHRRARRHGVPLAIVPAGTATSSPPTSTSRRTSRQAVQIGLHGAARRSTSADQRRAVRGDGRRGFDALMIRDADGGLKDRFGRARVRLDRREAPPRRRRSERGSRSTARLVRGQGELRPRRQRRPLFGGIDGFHDARPDDGLLELGVVPPRASSQWARTVARQRSVTAEQSPFVQTHEGRKVDVELTEVPYELDGGERTTVKHLKAKVEPKAITVRVRDGA